MTTSPPLSTASNSNSATALVDIRDIRAPVPIANPWVWLWWALALITVAALVAWFWRRRRKQSSPGPVEVPVPPHDRALEALRQALALIDQPRPFCISVSDTLRYYLEERFHMHAPERTTEEFLDELQSSPALMHTQKQLLGEFLTRCDLVKFARYEPGREELESLHAAAIRLVEETQPPPPAPPGPGESSQPPGNAPASTPPIATHDVR